MGVSNGAAASDYAVLTPERVSLEYEVAGVGSRSAAAMVDVTIQGVAWMALWMGTIGLVVAASPIQALSDNRALGLLLFAVLVLGSFLILWGYYIIFEIAWSGQTPGKRLLGLRVIRENGYALRAGDAVIRNLVRIIDGPPLMAVVGLIVMLLNSRARRLGDFAAGTIVVREGRRRSLADVAGIAAAAAAGEPAPRSLPALRPADATLVRDLLVRRAGLRPERRAELVQRLAAALARSYGLEGERAAAGDDEAFLASLVEGG